MYIEKEAKISRTFQTSIATNHKEETMQQVSRNVSIQ